MPSEADRLCVLCCNALQPKRGDEYNRSHGSSRSHRSRSGSSADNEVYRSWGPVRVWFDQHSTEDATAVMQTMGTCYEILNYVYLKDAPQDILDRFLQLDCLTLLQLCMLALSRAQEPFDDERRNNSWNPVRRWFEAHVAISPEQAQFALEETNHLSETVLDCVGWKQGPEDICESIARLQKVGAALNGADGRHTSQRSRQGQRHQSYQAISSRHGNTTQHTHHTHPFSVILEDQRDALSHQNSRPYFSAPSNFNEARPDEGYRASSTQNNVIATGGGSNSHIAPIAVVGPAFGTSNIPEDMATPARGRRFSPSSPSISMPSVLPSVPPLATGRDDSICSAFNIPEACCDEDNEPIAEACCDEDSEPIEAVCMMATPGRCDEDSEPIEAVCMMATPGRRNRFVPSLPSISMPSVLPSAPSFQPLRPQSYTSLRTGGIESDLRRVRIKRGQCPTCGMPTHTLKHGLFGATKLFPLTNEYVINGRCLMCTPSGSYAASVTLHGREEYAVSSHDVGDVSPRVATSSINGFQAHQLCGHEDGGATDSFGQSINKSPASQLRDGATETTQGGTHEETKDQGNERADGAPNIVRWGIQQDRTSDVSLDSNIKTNIPEIVRSGMQRGQISDISLDCNIKTNIPEIVRSGMQRDRVSDISLDCNINTNDSKSMTLEMIEEANMSSQLGSNCSSPQRNEMNLTKCSSLDNRESDQKLSGDHLAGNLQREDIEKINDAEKEIIAQELERIKATIQGLEAKTASKKDLSISSGCQVQAVFDPMQKTESDEDADDDMAFAKQLAIEGVNRDTSLSRIEQNEKIDDILKGKVAISNPRLSGMQGFKESLSHKVDASFTRHSRTRDFDDSLPGSADVGAEEEMEEKEIVNIIGERVTVLVRKKKRRIKKKSDEEQDDDQVNELQEMTNQYFKETPQRLKTSSTIEASFHCNKIPDRDVSGGDSVSNNEGMANNEDSGSDLGEGSSSSSSVVEKTKQDTSAKQGAPAAAEDAFEQHAADPQKSQTRQSKQMSSFYGNRNGSNALGNENASTSFALESLLASKDSRQSERYSTSEHRNVASGSSPGEAPTSPSSFEELLGAKIRANRRHSITVRPIKQMPSIYGAHQGFYGIEQKGATPLRLASSSTSFSLSSDSSSSSETNVTSHVSTPTVAFSLLELCNRALFPHIEQDELRRSQSWEPVREWFTHNPRCQILSLLQSDSRGRTPLHIACVKKAPVDIICLLLDSDASSAAVKTRDMQEKLQPLHWACSAPCCPEVILRVFEAYPEGAKAKSIHGMTPFMLAHPNVIENLISFTLDYNHKKLELFKDFMPPDIFQDSIMKNINKSPNCICWLNAMSCSRRVVSYMMLEFYLHISLIVLFVQASMLFISGETPISWAISMLPISSVFLILEAWQFWSYTWINQPSGYFLDLWNWIDLTTFGLAITSAITFLTNEPDVVSSEDAGNIRMLLMATGFFICICFVSYLRKTFFAFAIFVGGIANIIWVLTPFLVVSFLLLGAFAFGYRVQESNEEYDSLGTSFLGIFSLFVGADEEVHSILDVVFGSLIIIVLLNVVIAVVGQAWGEVTKNSKEVYWSYRLRFILEATRGGKNDDQFCMHMLGLRDILDKDWTSQNLKQYLGLTIYRGEQWGLYENPTRKKRDNLFQVGATLVLLFLFTVLGIFSFGLLWPMFVLEFLFTSKSAKSSSLKKLVDQAEEELNAIGELRLENQKQSEQIEALVSQIERLSQSMQLLVEHANSSRADAVVAEEITRRTEDEEKRRSIPETNAEARRMNHSIPVAVPFDGSKSQRQYTPPTMAQAQIAPSDLQTLREIVQQYAEAGNDTEQVEFVTPILDCDNATSKSSDLALFCLATLRSIARKSDANACMIIFGGTLDTIVETAHIHLNSVEIQSEVCGLLWYLSMNPTYQSQVITSGGCDAVLNAVMAHVENETFQVIALKPLQTLSFCDSAKTALASRLSLIACVMLNHRYNSTIQTDGCSIIGNIAELSDAPIAKHEIEAVLNSIIDHPELPEVHKAACAALRKLATSETNLEHLRSNARLQIALDLITGKDTDSFQDQFTDLFSLLEFPTCDASKEENTHRRTV